MKRLIKTQRELQRALNAKKSSLTDDDIFLSDAYSAMLLNMQHGVLSHLKEDNGKVFLKRLGSSADAAIAFTDGKDTYLNYEHPRTSTLTRFEKHLYYMGEKLHEDGHRLLTDFDIMKESQDAVESNTLYPMPTGNPYVKETLEALAKGTKASANLKKIYHDIFNIIEDGYINRAITTLCPGYGACLSYEVKVNSTFDCCSLSKMRELELPDHEILSNLIFFYVVHGYEAYGESDEDDIIKYMEELKPFLCKAVYESKPIKRAQYINDAFCYIFQVIKEMAKEEKEKKEQAQEPQEEPEGGASDNDKENDGKEDNKPQNEPQSESNDSETEHDKSSESEFEELLGGFAGSMQSSEKTDHQNMETPNSKAIEEVAEAMNNENPSPVPDCSSDEAEMERQMDAISENIAKEEIGKEQEQAIQEANEQYAKAPQSVPIHHNVKAKIIRLSVSEQQKEKYDELHGKLDIIVSRFVKEFEKELKDLQLGDNLNGCFAGKRLDTNHLYRQDKRVFCQKRLPMDIPNMAIGILLDDSGSMSNGNKINVAIESAYITYQFCRRLNIPVFVYGHNTEGNYVRMYCAADELSIDGNDKYRIFGLTAESTNRDGFALRYCLDKLDKIPAKDKIMFVSSDGLPNHGTYGAFEGKADCQDAVHSAIKKGITTITAGLGADAPCIKRVYQEGRSKNDCARFLDLTDISKLPKAFIKIIKEKLMEAV